MYKLFKKFNHDYMYDSLVIGDFIKLLIALICIGITYIIAGKATCIIVACFISVLMLLLTSIRRDACKPLDVSKFKNPVVGYSIEFANTQHPPILSKGQQMFCYVQNKKCLLVPLE